MSEIVTDEMVNAYKLAFRLYLDDLPARAPVNFSWDATKSALEAVIAPALASKDAEIEKLKAAIDRALNPEKYGICGIESHMDALEYMCGCLVAAVSPSNDVTNPAALVAALKGDAS